MDGFSELLGSIDVTGKPPEPSALPDDGFSSLLGQIDANSPDIASFDYNVPVSRNPVSALGRGMLRGIDQTQGTLYGFTGLLGAAMGFEPMRDFGYEGYLRNMDEAATNAAAIQDPWEEIENPGDALLWAAGVIGEQIFQLLGTAATGGVGFAVGSYVGKRVVERAVKNLVATGMSKELAERAVSQQVARRVAKGVSPEQVGAISGAYAANYAQIAGGSFGDIAQETGNFEPGIAAGWAVPGAAFDTLADVFIAKPLLNPILKGVDGAKLFTRGGAAAIGARTAAGAAMEGPTEYIQTGFEQMAMRQANPEFDIFSDEAEKERRTAGLAGMVVGGTAAGTASAAGGAIAQSRPAVTLSGSGLQGKTSPPPATDAPPADTPRGPVFSQRAEDGTFTAEFPTRAEAEAWVAQNSPEFESSTVMTIGNVLSTSGNTTVTIRPKAVDTTVDNEGGETTNENESQESDGLGQSREENAVGDSQEGQEETNQEILTSPVVAGATNTATTPPDDVDAAGKALANLEITPLAPPESPTEQSPAPAPLAQEQLPGPGNPATASAQTAPAESSTPATPTTTQLASSSSPASSTRQRLYQEMTTPGIQTLVGDLRIERDALVNDDDVDIDSLDEQITALEAELERRGESLQIAEPLPDDIEDDTVSDVDDVQDATDPAPAVVAAEAATPVTPAPETPAAPAPARPIIQQRDTRGFPIQNVTREDGVTEVEYLSDGDPALTAAQIDAGVNGPFISVEDIARGDFPANLFTLSREGNRYRVTSARHPDYGWVNAPGQLAEAIGSDPDVREAQQQRLLKRARDLGRDESTTTIEGILLEETTEDYKRETSEMASAESEDTLFPREVAKIVSALEGEKYGGRVRGYDTEAVPKVQDAAISKLLRQMRKKGNAKGVNGLTILNGVITGYQRQAERRRVAGDQIRTSLDAPTGENTTLGDMQSTMGGDIGTGSDALTQAPRDNNTPLDLIADSTEDAANVALNLTSAMETALQNLRVPTLTWRNIERKILNQETLTPEETATLENVKQESRRTHRRKVVEREPRRSGVRDAVSDRGQGPAPATNPTNAGNRTPSRATGQGAVRLDSAQETPAGSGATATGEATVRMAAGPVSPALPDARAFDSDTDVGVILDALDAYAVRDPSLVAEVEALQSELSEAAEITSDMLDDVVGLYNRAQPPTRTSLQRGLRSYAGPQYTRGLRRPGRPVTSSLFDAALDDNYTAEPTSEDIAKVKADYKFERGLPFVLRHIAARTKNPGYRALARWLASSPLTRNVGITADVLPDIGPDGLPNNYAALYHPETRDISVKLNARHYRDLDTTILHEALHAATYDILRCPFASLTAAQKQARNRLADVYDSAKEALTADGTISPPVFDKDGNMVSGNESDYAWVDFDEFIVGILADERLQTLLAGIRVTGETGFSARIKNLWDAFVDGLRGLIGIQAPADSILARSFNDVVTLVNGESARAVAARSGPPVFSRGEPTLAQDAAYMDAVLQGDMETAQRMVDEAASAQTTPTQESDIKNFQPVNQDVTATYEPFESGSGTIHDATLRHGPTGARMNVSLFKNPVNGKIDHIHISRIDTPESGQRQGGATALITEAKRYADETGLPIYVNATNEMSGPLFEKAGFRKPVTPYDFPLSERVGRSFPEQSAGAVYAPANRGGSRSPNALYSRGPAPSSTTTPAPKPDGGWRQSGMLGFGKWFEPAYDEYVRKDNKLRATSVKVGERLKAYNKLVKKHKPDVADLRDALGTTENKLTDDQQSQYESMTDREAAEGFRITAIKENIAAAKERQDAALLRLPEPLQVAVTELRSDMRAFGNRLQAIGAVSESMAGVIDANADIYLNRSFEIYDNPEYADRFKASTEPEVVEARNALLNMLRSDLHRTEATKIRRDARKGGTELTRAEALVLAKTAVTDNDVLIAFNQVMSVGDRNELEVLQGKLPGVKSTSILKRRQQLPNEIRRAWGEYTDPAVNYAKTMVKMSALVANHEFQTNFVDMGLNSPEPFLWKEGVSEGPQPANWIEIVPGLTDDPSPNPLRGVYGPKVITEVFAETAQRYKHNIVTETLTALTGFAMASKTVYNIPQSNARNALGNVLLAFSNGWFFQDAKVFKRLKDTIELGGPEVFGVQRTREGEVLDFITELVEEGIIDDNVKANIVRETTKIVFDRDPPEAWNKHVRGILTSAKKANQWATDTYQAGDNLFKVFGYLSELDMLQQAFPNMSLDQQKKMAAKRVRDTMPTYSLIPVIVQEFVKKQPYLAPFISWTSEIYRTSVNNIKTGIADVRSGNPVLQKAGIRRLAGFVTAQVMIGALASMSRLMAGASEEDDEALRRFLPEWQQNATLFITKRGDDGKISFWDLSYLNPYDVIHEPFIAMTREVRSEGSGPLKVLSAGAQELMKPWVNEQLFFGALADVARGVDAQGIPIYRDADSDFQKNYKRAMRVVDSLKPGSLNIANRIYMAATGQIPRSGRAYNLTNEILSPILGQRLTEVDVVQNFQIGKAGEFMRMDRSAKMLAGDAFRTRGTPNLGEIERAYLQGNMSRKEAFERIRRDVEALILLGGSEAAAWRALKAGGVTDQTIRQLRAGVYRRYIPSRAAIQAASGRPQGKERIEAIASAINSVPPVEAL